MGGSLSVTSTLGEGSTFTLEMPLPCSLRSTPQPSQADDSLRISPSDHNPLLGLRILVAEDNAVNRVVIKRMLDRLGCHVVIGEDGEQAWELYRNSSAQLILSDIEMPNLDGYGSAMRIREDEQQQGLPAIPIIALSAHTFAEHQQRALSSGFSAFIPKPVMLNELREGILAALSGRPQNPA